jgi:hypothetical protein
VWQHFGVKTSDGSAGDLSFRPQAIGPGKRERRGTQDAATGRDTVAILAADVRPAPVLRISAAAEQGEDPQEN